MPKKRVEDGAVCGLAGRAHRLEQLEEVNVKGSQGDSAQREEVGRDSIPPHGTIAGSAHGRCTPINLPHARGTKGVKRAGLGGWVYFFVDSTCTDEFGCRWAHT